MWVRVRDQSKFDVTKIDLSKSWTARMLSKNGGYRDTLSHSISPDRIRWGIRGKRKKAFQLYEYRSAENHNRKKLQQVKQDRRTRGVSVKQELLIRNPLYDSFLRVTIMFGFIILALLSIGFRHSWNGGVISGIIGSSLLIFSFSGELRNKYIEKKIN